MVTLRRDVAAANKKRRYYNSTDNAQMTEYDKFMEQKKRNEKFFSYQKEDISAGVKDIAHPSNAQDCLFVENCVDTSYNYFSAPVAKEKVSKVAETVSRDEYGEYLKAQLNRTQPERLLTKEEFYATKFVPTSKKADKPKKRVRQTIAKGKRQNLSKNGKIFIAIYVLVVMIVASIILTVNSISEPTTVNASAIERGTLGNISPLVHDESADKDTNWFDKLLDTISNS